MRLWAESSPQPAPRPAAEEAGQAPLPGDVQGEIVMALAGMVLGSPREAGAW
jgi:hypothetical protein